MSRSLLIAVVLAALGAAARWVLSSVAGDDLPFITYFPGLLAAAVWGGFVGGFACLVLSAALGSATLNLPESDALLHFLLFWISGGLVTMVGAAMAQIVRALEARQAQLQAAQGDLQTLAGELDHRNRNVLSVVLAIVSRSTRAAASAAEAEQLITARIEAFARAQDELVRVGGAAAPLRALLERTLEPFDLSRFSFEESPPAEVPSAVAPGLALLIHELGTNAVKYGALSAPGGRVLLAWSEEGSHARLTWREADGPPVAAPASMGSGAQLLAVALTAHGGHAERRFEPLGVVCELLIPNSGKAP